MMSILKSKQLMTSLSLFIIDNHKDFFALACTIESARDSKIGLLGNSLMVEQRTLTSSIFVRIQVPQPVFNDCSLSSGFV